MLCGAASRRIIQVDESRHLSPLRRPLVDLTSPEVSGSSAPAQITTLTGIPASVTGEIWPIPLDVWKPCPDFLELKGELMLVNWCCARRERIAVGRVAHSGGKRVGHSGGMTWLKIWLSKPTRRSITPRTGDAGWRNCVS